MICSARLGRQDLVEVLINQFEVNIDSISDQDKDWCALQAAIASNNLQLAKFMVINLGNSNRGQFHKAVKPKFELQNTLK